MGGSFPLSYPFENVSGVIVFPIGNNKASTKNCINTIINDYNYNKFIEKVESKASSLNSLTNIRNKIKRIVGDDRFVVWGARDTALKNNKKLREFIEYIVNKSEGRIPETWVSFFYKKKKVLCPGLVLGGIESPEIAEALWETSEWKYIVFMKPFIPCREMLDPRTCDPLEKPGVLERKIIIEKVLKMRDHSLRSVTLREFEGPNDERRSFILNIIKNIIRNYQPSVSWNTTCDFLREVFGNNRFEDITEYIKKLLEIYGAVLLYGPPGSGKTSIAKCMATLLRAKLIVVTGHMWLSRHSLIGGYLLRGGDSVWEPGIIVKAAREGEKTVILFDEINRSEPERILAELFTALASRDRILEIPDAPDERRVSLDNVYIIATANSVDSVALAKMGVALHRRFPVVHIVLEKDELDDIAKNIASILDRELRGSPCKGRVIKASLNVWKKAFEIIRGARGPHVAPGWSYAIDFAKILDHELMNGCSNDNISRACKRGVEAWYREYMRLVLPDVETSSEPSRELEETCLASLAGV